MMSMSTTTNHLAVAETYLVLAELEGGSHTAFALKERLEDSEVLHSWTEVEVNAALWYLEARRIVDMAGSPAGLVWSLRGLRYPETLYGRNG
jgi:hypothetical protein